MDGWRPQRLATVSVLAYPQRNALMASIQAGTVLAERYRLEHELGRGGMGEVWAGQDQKLRRPVAIKVMSARIAESESALQRFEREAMAVARLRSPYIVQVHDYGVDEDRPFIVMELVEGEDLKAMLAREKRLSIEDTARIVVQVAKALHAAHQAGIVHRDLKPGNIFLAQEHDEVTARVFDFGVAKAMTDLGEGTDSDMTGEGQLLGTPRYMSPEQAHGAKRVDHRSDLWALAVIAYSCITGRPPFVGAGTGELLVKICTERAIAPSTLIGHLPPEVDAFFEEALARDPDERFQSARELASHFAQLTDQSVSTFGLNVSAPTPSWSGSAVGAPPSDPSASALTPPPDLNLPALAPPSDRGAVTRAEGPHGDTGALEASQGTHGVVPAPMATGQGSPEEGTLGPATRTVAGPGSWLRSRQGLLVATLTGALLVGGAVWMVMRGDGTSETAPTSAQAKEDAPPTEPPTAPAKDEKATGQNDAAAPPTSDASADKSAKAPADSSEPGKVGKKPPTAKPAAKPKDSATPPPPPPTKPTKSKDGLDLFNKRW